jgi:hypothetical protein
LITRIAFFIFLFCLSISGYAQLLPAFSGIEKDSIKTLYVNIDQRISINPQSSDLAYIEIKASNASIQKLNDTTYALRYNMPFEASKIKLYYRNLPVDIINVKVESMPAPTVILDGNQGPNLSIASLRNVKKVDIVFPKNKEIIRSLELFQCRILITEPGKPVTFNTNFGGTVIPEYISKMLSELKPKSTIRFDEFKIKTPQNYVLDIEGSSITFIVVE